jgi:hypothetical protein
VLVGLDVQQPEGAAVGDGCDRIGAREADRKLGRRPAERDGDTVGQRVGRRVAEPVDGAVPARAEPSDATGHAVGQPAGTPTVECGAVGRVGHVGEWVVEPVLFPRDPDVGDVAGHLFLRVVRDPELEAELSALEPGDHVLDVADRNQRVLDTAVRRTRRVGEHAPGRTAGKRVGWGRDAVPVGDGHARVDEVAPLYVELRVAIQPVAVQLRHHEREAGTLVAREAVGERQPRALGGLEEVVRDVGPGDPVGVDEHLEEFPVVPVEVDRELVERRVQPVLLRLDVRRDRHGPVEHRRMWGPPGRSEIVRVALQRVEPRQRDGFLGVDGELRARVGREPLLELTEVEVRGVSTDDLRDLLGRLGVGTSVRHCGVVRRRVGHRRSRLLPGPVPGAGGPGRTQRGEPAEDEEPPTPSSSGPSPPASMGPSASGLAGSPSPFAWSRSSFDRAVQPIRERTP